MIKKIDLEKLAREYKWRWKHADYVLEANGAIVVVEKTSRAKINDVHKLKETIKQIRNGALSPYINIQSYSARVIAVIHCRKRLDPEIGKILLSLTQKSKENTIYTSANCNRHLRSKLRGYGIKLRFSLGGKT